MTTSEAQERGVRVALGYKAVVALAALAALVSSGASLHARATMADAESKIAVLQALRVEDRKAIDAMGEQIGDVHRWLLEDRGTAAQLRTSAPTVPPPRRLPSRRGR